MDFLSEFHAGGNISAAADVVNTLHLLNANPGIANELCKQLAPRGDLDLASMEQVPLLDHVLRESLRMIPPVGVFGRNVLKTKRTVLGDRELPPDTAVMVCMQSVQRSASHWKDPDVFNPDRWANGAVEANPIGSDYFFTFGRGSRICAGAEMAMLCMKVVLASILSRAAVKTSGPFQGVIHCGVIETPELKGRLIPHA